MAQARPPQILEISRDYLKPDAVAENRKLERRAEHLCRILGFSHSYLTIESVSGPAEMWYLNGFQSQAEVEKLRQEYEHNTELLAALNDITQKKASLKRAESTDEFAHYRSVLSRGEPLILGRGRFFVIVFFDGDPPLNGTVFEMKDKENTKPGYMMTTDNGTEPELRLKLKEAGMLEPDIERLFKQAS